jgi:hypothetical protein
MIGLPQIVLDVIVVYFVIVGISLPVVVGVYRPSVVSGTYGVEYDRYEDRYARRAGVISIDVQYVPSDVIHAQLQRRPRVVRQVFGQRRRLRDVEPRGLDVAETIQHVVDLERRTLEVDGYFVRSDQ